MFLIKDCGWDDFEHLASSWFIFNGYVPYRDFFQHHHPLLWYMLTPVFFLVDHPIDSFWIGRVLAGVFWCGGCFFIGKIIHALGGKIRAVLYAIFIYLSCPVAAEIYIQNRPDTYMIFFLLWGLYEWILFFTHKKTKDLVLCYLFFFISFAFLQKALLVLFSFGIYQIYLLIRKKLKWKFVIKALILPFFLTFVYMGYLFYTGLLIRYFELNWILNGHWFRDYQMYQEDIPDYFYAGLYILFCLCGILWGKGSIGGLSFCGLIFGLIFYMIPKPYNYYWTLWMPFASIVLGMVLEKLTLSLKRLSNVYAIGIFIFSIFFTTLYVFIPSTWKTIDAYFVDDTKFLVLQIKKREKLVDYADLYSAFLRKFPEDYYWFSLDRGAIYDSSLFHRHQMPDWDKVIYEQKPKYVIYRKVYDLTTSKTGNEDIQIMGVDEGWLEDHYQKVKQLNLWVRIDNK